MILIPKSDRDSPQKECVIHAKLCLVSNYSRPICIDNIVPFGHKSLQASNW